MFGGLTRAKLIAVALMITTMASFGASRSVSAEFDYTDSQYIPAGYSLKWSDEFNNWDDFKQYWSTSYWSGWQITKPWLYVEDGVLHMKQNPQPSGFMLQPADIGTRAHDSRGSTWFDPDKNAWVTDDNYWHKPADALYPVKFAWRYGYVEVRMKMRLNNGSTPAFWMKSNTTLKDRQEKNYITETDIAEACGTTHGCGTGYNQSSKIKWGPCSDQWPSCKNVVEGQYYYAATQGDSTPSTEGADGNIYVNYGFLWTPDKMESYVNGKRYSTISIKDEDAFDKAKTTGENAKFAGMRGFHDPAFLIFDNHYSAKQDKTNTPPDLQVDYVRVYQKPGEGDIYVAPRILTTSLGSGQVNVPYNDMVTVATQPTKDNRFVIADGNLPDGLLLDNKTGKISGIPSKAGKYTFTVRHTNDQFTGIDEYKDQTYVVDIAPASTPGAINPDKDSSAGEQMTASAAPVSKNAGYIPGVPAAGVWIVHNWWQICVAMAVIASAGVVAIVVRKGEHIGHVKNHQPKNN